MRNISTPFENDIISVIHINYNFLYCFYSHRLISKKKLLIHLNEFIIIMTSSSSFSLMHKHASLFISRYQVAYKQHTNMAGSTKVVMSSTESVPRVTRSSV